MYKLTMSKLVHHI